MAPIRSQPTRTRLSSTNSILEIGSSSPEPEIIPLDAPPTPTPAAKSNAEGSLVSPPLSPRVEAGPSTNGVGKGKTKPRSKPVAKKTIPVPTKVIELSDSSDAEVVEVRKEVNGKGKGRAIDVDDEDEVGMTNDKGKGKGRLPAFLRLDSDSDDEPLYLPSTPSKRPTNGAPAPNDTAPANGNDNEPFDDFYASDDEPLYDAQPQPHAQRSPSPQPQRHSPSLSPEFDPPPPRPSQRKSQSPVKGRVNLVPHERHRIEDFDFEELDDFERGLPPIEPLPFDLDAVSGSQVASGSNVNDTEKVNGGEKGKGKGKGKERREITQEPTPPSQNPTPPRRSSPTLNVDPDPQPPTNTSRHANADGTLDVDAWRYDGVGRGTVGCGESRYG
ncbi:hypothetical protein NMY22_g3978 [Coprinellus aureogranulatus]|nr:hypothetical protein NMY22_g3978 [Coprinellus aureogranulatus]